MFAKNGRSFDPLQIPKAIKNAGFTAAEVVVVAAGTLERTNKGLQLRIPDLAYPFLLLGGDKSAALARGINIAGKRFEITGRLQQQETPILTVDDFREIR